MRTRDVPSPTRLRVSSMYPMMPPISLLRPYSIISRTKSFSGGFLYRPSKEPSTRTIWPRLTALRFLPCSPSQKGSIEAVSRQRRSRSNAGTS